MKLYRELDVWQLFRHKLPSTATLGFIPTMGNLHRGHASLFEKSLAENDYTVASIFVNPTQFNQMDDYTNYPSTIEADIERLTQLGVDFCLLPKKEEMYSDNYRYQINETQRSLTLEGAHRPGHFTGVLTIVMKLFNLVKPHRAYFGEKDYQQFLLIRDMVAAFFMDIEVKACPTVREKSGLAYSSRNNRLSREEREVAERFAHIFQQPLTTDEMKKELEPLGVQVEYIEEQANRRFAAVTVGGIRLIDNYCLSTAYRK